MKIIGKVALLFMMIASLTHCVRLEVATPDKPINIDMNVKIDHDIRVSVDKQIEDKINNK